MRQSNEAPSGIVLFAKQSGNTSFSSLSSIKKALGTSKVGHTGTLDSFADGLLVVLTGRLTRLVPHITGFDKTYLAVIAFGTETDTLDPTGTVVRTGAIPTRAQVEAVLPQFRGKIQQVPPVYSAIHVGGGKRASELAREGKTADIPARNITIYDLELLDFSGQYALVEVSCSKGTYIRALARDIAAACGSCAHLAALRRTRVGPFLLKDAAGANDLGTFSLAAVKKDNADKNDTRSADTFYPKIRASLRAMTGDLATCCGFVPVSLTVTGAHAYANGRPLKHSHFYYPAQPIAPAPAHKNVGETAQLAAFYPDGQFAGVVQKNGKRLTYGFVIPRKNSFAVYTWEQIADGRFASAWKEQGTALTIGSFDGPHFGHEALFQAILAQENLVPGVITFSRSLRGLKNAADYAGDVATLSQKLQFFEQKGFTFAVVIDFSSDFARMQGTEFLSKLIAGCNMKCLVEGKDFCCGYQGATDVAQIMDFSHQQYVAFMAIAPILHEGEKISSSRIRAALAAGDVRKANDMLHHPFALDCAGWDWKRDGDTLTAKKAGMQVLPKDGDYRVQMVFAQTGTANTNEAPQTDAPVTAHADCTIANGTIRLRNMPADALIVQEMLFLTAAR